MGESRTPAAFPVVERFVSVNGEGARAGQLAAFVRFAGCNLSCSWCDTAWANQPDCPAETMDTAAIMAYARNAGVQCVTLTGGEPLLQEGIGTLIAALACDGGFRVEVETNGAVPLDACACMRDGLPGDARNLVSFTMDCKLPGSGMDAAMLPENHRLLDMRDSVKFVIADDVDLEAAADVIRRRELQSRCRVFLSPVFGLMDAARIVDFMKEEHLGGVRLQLQLHKIIWPMAERGV